MTSSLRSLRSLFVGIVVGVAASLGALTLWRPVLQPWLPFGDQHATPSPTQPVPAAHKPEPTPTPSAVHPASHGASSAPTALPDNMMVVSPERLQSIGVRFDLAAQRPLERLIRTVGRVEVDETRLAHVNIKIEGWIDELFVNYTGERVKKDQLLFTVYSPELVATQQEYLLALKSRRTLGASEFQEVAVGAQALLDAARQRLRLWDIPDHQIADLERTGRVLKALHNHSPISGTVINKVALVGMHVNPGDELYTIADLSHIWIIADIYEYELPLIKVGQPATVTLSYDPGTVLRGKVSFIYPTLDAQTRTAKVRFELDNPEEQLKPGMYANVELKIPLGTRLVIPKEAVLESGERQVIFIHHGGGTLEWRTVKLGMRAGEWIEVLDGLKEGDHVVTSANFLIDSESRLKAAVGGMQGMQH
ncbi:MAG: efflux RND transporter periplasmic adaptor subunit [Candidatus Binatia bacterium]